MLSQREGEVFKLQTEEQLDISAEGHHMCKKDSYKAGFVFSGNEFDRFILIYDVTGPDKNYVSETVYERKSQEF